MCEMMICRVDFFFRQFRFECNNFCFDIEFFCLISTIRLIYYTIVQDHLENFRIFQNFMQKSDKNSYRYIDLYFEIN